MKPGCVGGLLLLFSSCVAVTHLPTNSVTILNASGQHVSGVRVEACGRSVECGDLRPGGTAHARYHTPGQEDNLVVRGRFGDGTEIGDSGTYIVWEEYFTSRVLVIRQDGSLGVQH
jgi:hypothetical protein